MFYSAIVRRNPTFNETDNLSNMKQIGLAMMMYSADNNDGYPSSANWKYELSPYVRNSEVFTCLEIKKHKTNFAMNDFYSFSNIEYVKMPFNEVLLFEAPLGINNGNEANVYTQKEKIVTGYCDGHARTNTPTEVIQEIINSRSYYNQ